LDLPVTIIDLNLHCRAGGLFEREALERENMLNNRLNTMVMAATAMALSISLSSTARGQGGSDPATLIAAQREAMAPLAYMDGVWRGSAWTILESGEKRTVTQTERIGPFLDGSVKVIEGRGYNPEGKIDFNALAILSYSPETKGYVLHSHAMGRVGDFALKPTTDGYLWEIPAGPMTIRYTAVIKDGTWREMGDRILPGKEPVRFFEMNLKRLRDTDWPAAGAIPPK
jgi:hypothetical protein